MLNFILAQLQLVVNALPTIPYFAVFDVNIYNEGEDVAADVQVLFPVGRDHVDPIQNQLAAKFNNFKLIGYYEDVAQFHPTLSFEGIVFSFKTVDSAGGAGGGAG